MPDASFLEQAVSFVLHIDIHLFALVEAYGAWLLAILFLIVFCETGLVVTPFLPGDSLLFAAGAGGGGGGFYYFSCLSVLLAGAGLGGAADY